MSAAAPVDGSVAAGNAALYGAVHRVDQRRREGGMIISNEFAAVDVEIDEGANGPRLKIEDLETGAKTFLDPLELQSLVWVPHRDFEPFLDPSAYRWKEDTHSGSSQNGSR